MDGDPLMDRETSLLLEEWKEIRETLRYFGNKRFAQLTVFIAASGFMLDAFLGRTDATARIALSVVGVLFAFLFLVMEISSVRYWNRFADRGKKIEEDAGTLELMTSYRPRERIVSATHATYALYGGVILLWLLALAFGIGI